MSLLTDALRKQLPPLYTQEQEPNPMVHIKFFLPGSSWTWYVTEGEPEGDDYLLFGFVFGFEGEWGYFTLRELEQVRNQMKLPVERDEHFTPAPWKEVKARHEKEHGIVA